MRVLAWNCRGLRGLSTVSQQKESLRDLKPDLVFISEKKKKKGFVGSVCKKMGWKDRWFVLDPIGRSAGLLLGWTEEVNTHQIISSRFSLEVEFETIDKKGKMWEVFVSASNKEKDRMDQWHELWSKKGQWGSKWILSGGFKDIRKPQEKNGGRIRTVASCKGFVEFIKRMNMEVLRVAVDLGK